MKPRRPLGLLMSETGDLGVPGDRDGVLVSAEVILCGLGVIAVPCEV